MAENKSYLKIRLGINGFDPEMLPAVLFETGCLGIEEFSADTWLAYFPAEFGENNLSSLMDRLQAIHPGLHPDQVAITPLPASDWNSEWKKHFRPLKVGEKIWVAPPWDLPEVAAGETVIIIDPQMAFGTGGHESTRLMIRAVEKYVRKGDTVLDAGSGSGILSILARKLGAVSVFGFDIEPEAIENAYHNLELNHTDGIEFRIGDQSVIPAGEFGLVLANINRNVLLDMFSLLAEKTQKGGRLVLSGLLDSDEKTVLRQKPRQLLLVEKQQENEWIALIFEKTGE